MAHRNVELLIGRLVTDNEFRLNFLADPEKSLRHLLDRGVLLTVSEMMALMTTDAQLWCRVAEQIDPRLRKANLKLAGDEL